MFKVFILQGISLVRQENNKVGSMQSKLLTFLAIAWTNTFAYAQEPMDGYYSNDLLDAVNEAKQTPHHYDYSSTYRYKRTTSQSIEMDRLDLGEMDDAMLQGALDAPSAGEPEGPTKAEIANLDEGEVDTDSIQPRVDYSLPTLPIASGGSISRSGNGVMSTQGIQNAGSIISTPRP